MEIVYLMPEMCRSQVEKQSEVCSSGVFKGVEERKELLVLSVALSLGWIHTLTRNLTFTFFKSKCWFIYFFYILLLSGYFTQTKVFTNYIVFLTWLSHM